MTEEDRTIQAQALDLFMQALEQPTAWRDKWLAERAGDNPSLVAAVERLNAADVTQGGFLHDSPRLEDDRTGELLGGWRVADMIASGGMGRVYRVERSGADFAQVGALKIIRFELQDTPEHIATELLRRFQNERQILANINHPNVAAVLDGGTTQDGMPFLVMEYVEGTDLVSYANAHSLTLSQRLDLFMSLLDALGAVHANLIVHRDLKPSNILVDESGHLKLLDFGIAKVLQDQPGLTSQNTMPDANAMTPDYASPEQMLGQPVTVATDIYALGLLLYRLLTGVPAYSVHSLPPVEAQELICKTDPIPPSRTLRDLPNDHVSSTQLAGDLDAIVLKAVRKEAIERYGSTAEMANDIKRYMACLPISARADTVRYRARKFLARNRWLLAGTAVVFSALSLGLGVALWQADVARAAAIVAQQEADKANAVTEFLQDVLSQADPLEANENPTVREALDSADDQIGDRFSDHPEIEAAVRRTLGWTQLSLGRVARARPNLEQAYVMNDNFYGARHPTTLKSQADLAWLAFEASDYDGAITQYQEVLAGFDGQTPPMLIATVHNDFGVVLDRAGQADDAITHYQAAMELYRTIPGDKAVVDLGAATGNLGAALHTVGEVEQAEVRYLEHIAMTDQAIADGIRNVRSNLMYTLNNYAVLLSETGRRDEALAPLARSAELRVAILGAEHPHTARTFMNVSRLSLEMGDLDQARSAFERMQPGLEGLPSVDDTVLRSRILESRLLAAQDDTATALDNITQLLLEFATLTGDQFAELHAQAELQAGYLRAQLGESGLARAHFIRAIEIRVAQYGADHYLVENARQLAADSGYSDL